MAEAGSLIVHSYSDFRGIDKTNDEVNLYRSPDSLNMWKDYSKLGQCIETRPGTELFKSFTDPIYGLFKYEVGLQSMLLIHSGTKLYKYANNTLTELKTGLKPIESNAFVYNQIWYFKDGINYLKYDGTTLSDVVGYVPMVKIGCDPITGAGTLYEDINLLSDYRKQGFVGDGETKTYKLGVETIDSDGVPIVEINGTRTTDFTTNYSKGEITFTTAPAKPLTTGQDNVTIQYKKATSGQKSRILNCTLLEVFDNRVFFSGNKDYPNTIFHSSLNDPSYCSELDAYQEGLDLAKVKGLVAGNNALWVFKEPSQANTTIFYHNPTIDSEYGKVYPSTHSSISTGCIGKAINFGDDICFFSPDGMEAITQDITTEQTLTHRSSFIDSMLINETDYSKMVLAEYKGYLMVFINNHCYLADSNCTYNKTYPMKYEWYYWELPFKVKSANVIDGVLYLGGETGIYTLSDYSSDRVVNSYWTTTYDEFGYQAYQKTTNKRGSVADMSGAEISVYAKIDKKDFELIKTHTNVTKYAVNRIKKKKWKGIQLRFSSTKPFKLYSCTLECYLGAYVKR